MKNKFNYEGGEEEQSDESGGGYRGIYLNKLSRLAARGEAWLPETDAEDILKARGALKKQRCVEKRPDVKVSLETAKEIFTRQYNAWAASKRKPYGHRVGRRAAGKGPIRARPQDGKQHVNQRLGQVGEDDAAPCPRWRHDGRASALGDSAAVLTGGTAVTVAGTSICPFVRQSTYCFPWRH